MDFRQIHRLPYLEEWKIPGLSSKEMLVYYCLCKIKKRKTGMKSAVLPACSAKHWPMEKHHSRPHICKASHVHPICRLCDRPGWVTRLPWGEGNRIERPPHYRGDGWNCVFGPGCHAWSICPSFPFPAAAAWCLAVALIDSSAVKRPIDLMLIPVVASRARHVYRCVTGL